MLSKPAVMFEITDDEALTLYAANLTPAHEVNANPHDLV